MYFHLAKEIQKKKIGKEHIPSAALIARRMKENTKDLRPKNRFSEKGLQNPHMLKFGGQKISFKAFQYTKLDQKIRTECLSFNKISIKLENQMGRRR